MNYIADYREGQKFIGIYLCKSKQDLKTKAGKPYGSLLLQDKTGVIDAKIWEYHNGIEDFSAMDFIMAEGAITSFQGSRQVNISRVRKAQEGEYDPAEYIPASPFDREEMFAELQDLVRSIKEPHLRKLAEKYFVADKEFIEEFKEHSAAKTVHHGYVGGLLEHTLAVARMCDFMAAHYRVLNRDLLLAAAIFHDIGKMWELEKFPMNEYTDGGQLLGHIFLGAELVGREAEKIEGFPPILLRELQHCILSHHREYEFGSPKKPAMAEAIALAYADDLDAKMETITEVYEKADPTLSWLGFNRYLDSNIRQSSGYIKKRKEEDGEKKR